MRRSRALGVAGLLTVTLVTGSFFAGPVRDALDRWRAGRAWPADRASVTAAMDAVNLPDDYVSIECPSDTTTATRCWSTRLTPEQALPDLRAALNVPRVDVIEVVPLSAPNTPEGPAAATVAATLAGTYDQQGFALSAQRDFDDQAATWAELWRDTTTVSLFPVLTAP